MGSVYTVKEGDDCSKIAASSFTTAAAIVAANQLPEDCKTLQPGQVICIPRAPVCPGESYIVQSGDDCTKIGAAKGVSADAIVRANGITDDCRTIQIGQSLYVLTHSPLLLLQPGMVANSFPTAAFLTPLGSSARPRRRLLLSRTVTPASRLPWGRV
jgi:LysM repeat protein